MQIQNPKSLNIHPHTFGKSKGAIVLCDKLNKQYPRLSGEVARLLQRYMNELMALDQVKDIKIRNVWQDRSYLCYKKYLKEMERWPEDLKHYTNLVISTLYKEQCRKWKLGNMKEGKYYKKNKI
jgi:hypothetical protein